MNTNLRSSFVNHSSVRLPLWAGAALACATTALAQQGDGPRAYSTTKTLAGANAVTFTAFHATGNASPLDPARGVTPEADVDANLALIGYHKILPVFGRTAMASLLMPVGNVDSEVNTPGQTLKSAASGFGDPALQFNVNLYGAPALMTLADVARYEPRFTLDVLTTVAFPIGDYDSDHPINIGQNRWYGRFGLPMTYRLGPWIPGQRTTLELTPAVWWFAENDDYFGDTLRTDPLVQLEAHLTHDFTETFWGSLDTTWFLGAKSEFGGTERSSLNALGVGVTFGYQINDQFMLTAGYMATVNDRSSKDLEMDEFRLGLTYGWHKLIQGMNRLKGDH